MQAVLVHARNMPVFWLKLLSSGQMLVFVVTSVVPKRCRYHFLKRCNSCADLFLAARMLRTAAIRSPFSVVVNRF